MVIDIWKTRYIPLLQKLLNRFLAENVPQDAKFNEFIIALKNELIKSSDLYEHNQKNALLFSCVHSFPIASMILDVNGNIVFSNNKASNLTGYSNENLNQLHLKNLQIRFNTKNWAFIVNDLHQTGDSTRREMSIRHKDGHEIPLESYISKFPQTNEDVFLFSMRSLADEQSYERALLNARDQALEASRLKNEFISNMSHELRTPMNAIMGMSELLKDTEISELQEKFILKIEDAGKILMHVINDILDLTKIEAGGIEISHIPFDCRLILEKLVQTYAPKAQKKGLHLYLDMPATMDGEYVGDPIRIRRIFQNLITNAIKFTETGHVIIQVKDIGHTSSTRTLLFEIIDTGIGIEKEQQEQLFLPFEQADGSTTRKYGGTGLGLTVVQKLVNAMGGSIGVSSQLDKGSRFWFQLELSYDPSQLNFDQKNASLKDKNILVVDRHHVEQKIIINILSDFGMQVVLCNDGTEAIHFLKQASKIDIILFSLDHESEIENDWLQEIHAMEPTIPVLLAVNSENESTNSLIEDKIVSSIILKPYKKNHINKFLQDAFTQNMPQSYYKKVKLIPDIKPINTNQSHRKILIVEDNPDNQVLMVYLLRSLGVEPELAENGEVAIRKCASTAFDLVLMDWHMPIMDGLTASRAIRENEKSNGINSIIIGVTADSFEDVQLECKKAGMDGFIPKPVTLKNLKNTLSHWLPMT